MGGGTPLEGVPPWFAASSRCLGALVCPCPLTTSGQSLRRGPETQNFLAQADADPGRGGGGAMGVGASTGAPAEAAALPEEAGGGGGGGGRRSRRVQGLSPPEDCRDWAGLPEELLVKVAEKVHVRKETEWAWREQHRSPYILGELEKRTREGLGLLAFAMVCKPWRKAQIKVGGPLRSRVMSDVILPGRVELVKWALAEGCPRERASYDTMATRAAEYGHEELVLWLVKDEGFELHPNMMAHAVRRGDLELMQLMRAEGYSIHQDACEWELCSAAALNGRLEILKWLRAEGCEWDHQTCTNALMFAEMFAGNLDVLRWARENGCEWDVETRDGATELGYTDDFGNLFEFDFGDEDAFEDEHGYSDGYSDDE